ncbi:Hypothetical_protein [Hexamita inflata]|uniref:Hypothetical_protein n=1 Tax=Hexamita inflata TaxID=28002 RepID=A0AA86PU84_9EUKA|nr:Hypothetical protein HINF_LOCUS28674 [Hexamita inflata]CAI9967544.1 Hypothetical protein HINF_LOCUS55189 [Hexamita inflata]
MLKNTKQQYSYCLVVYINYQIYHLVYLVDNNYTLRVCRRIPSCKYIIKKHKAQHFPVLLGVWRYWEISGFVPGNNQQQNIQNTNWEIPSKKQTYQTDEIDILQALNVVHTCQTSTLCYLSRQR